MTGPACLPYLPSYDFIRRFVENTGGTEARDVVLDADFPVGLRGTFAPRSIELLRLRERHEITSPGGVKTIRR